MYEDNESIVQSIYLIYKKYLIVKTENDKLLPVDLSSNLAVFSSLSIIVSPNDIFRAERKILIAPTPLCNTILINCKVSSRVDALLVRMKSSSWSDTTPVLKKGV